MTIGVSRLRPGRHPLIYAVAGFGCLYAVAIMFFYCDWLFDIPGADPLSYAAALNGALCASALGAWIAARRGYRSALVATILGAALYAVAFVALLTALAFTSMTCALISAAGAGGAVGVLMPLWFVRLEKLAARHFPIAIGVGSLVAGVAALILDACPVPLLALLAVLAIGVSLFLLYCPRISAPQGEEAGSASAGEGEGGERGAAVAFLFSDDSVSGTSDGASLVGTLLIPGLYVVILSFAYGMLDVVAMASPAASASLSGLVSQIGGFAVIVLFLMYVQHGGRSYASLLNVALGVVATGALFLPFLPPAYRLVLVVLAHMGWEVALLGFYSLVVGCCRKDAVTLFGWAALAFALPRPALLAGSGVAALLAQEGQFAFTQMTLVAFALLYLIVSGIALLRNREQRAFDRVLRRKDEALRRYREARSDLRAIACEELASECRLTKREAELLLIFAQGRDAAYAERTMYLSRNTVKSYAKSLYAKLGVHSKQELIDKVNGVLPSD